MDEMVIENRVLQQPKMKRTKTNNNECIEKILLDFGFQDDCPASSMMYSIHKKTYPVDEFITVQLENPKALAQRDFGPTFDDYRPYTDKKDTKATLRKEYPTISVTNSDDSKENIPQNTLRKTDLTFRNSKDYAPNSGVRKEKKSSAIFGKNNDDCISDLKSPFGLLNIKKQNNLNIPKSNKKNNLRKSLLEEFEEASRRESNVDEIQLPSEDKNCNKELEEILQSLNTFKAKPTESEEQNLLSGISNNTTKDTSTLSNHVHNILYSKLNATSGDEDDKVSENQDEFFSFSNNNSLLHEENSQYDLSNYSDNSSSNVGSYVFREEPETQNQPKMFQLFNQYNLNLKEGQVSNPYHFEKENSNSNFFIHEQSQGEQNQYSNQSATMFQDYMFYMKQNSLKQTQTQNYQSQKDKEEGDVAREARLSKLNNSPLKKPKKLYCNDKLVPAWAADMAEIEKTSREQKKFFNTNQIFGHFNVENLNLEMVFQTNEPRLRQPRGSSANWRNDANTPSAIKSYMKKDPVSQKDLSNTKKAIDFKSGTKSKSKK